ncbi:MAG: ABC transporter ATP-binding protein [Candidatus Nanopelagicales bacterium]|jgi:branched-chain amino acid transport system ATP-binding protein|nr:ABC transporter ATP-binding protein [Candidatus Nanopelagicales bacterium]
MSVLLDVANLNVSYGGVQAVRDVSLRVEEGEVVALLGPNGAGKSSTLRSIVGLIKSQGDITFKGQRVSGRACERIVSLGLTLVPEGRRLFPQLTVRENLLLGASRGSHDETYERLLDTLPILAERQRQYAGTLSGGEQQQVAIARALMSRPQLLLIDEPSLGLAPTLVTVVYGLLSDLRETGLSMMIVEQEVMRVLRFADRAYAMATGSIVLEGPAAELLASDQVKDVYLGVTS